MNSPATISTPRRFIVVHSLEDLPEVAARPGHEGHGYTLPNWTAGNVGQYRATAWAYLNREDGGSVVYLNGQGYTLKASEAPAKLATMTDDFDHEVTEARVLPIGGGGNIICGRVGYEREMANRRAMNKRNGSAGQWDLPAWESLRVYFANGEYIG